MKKTFIWIFITILIASIGFAYHSYKEKVIKVEFENFAMEEKKYFAEYDHYLFLSTQSNTTREDLRKNYVLAKKSYEKLKTLEVPKGMDNYDKLNTYYKELLKQMGISNKNIEDIYISGKKRHPDFINDLAYRVNPDLIDARRKFENLILYELHKDDPPQNFIF